MKTMYAGAALPARILTVLALAAALAGCGGSLDSLDGPESGLVYGLVCTEVASLSAATEMPASQAALVSEGDCTILRTPVTVKITKTVMMPGTGKFSQFEYPVQGKTRRVWISTAKIRV